MRHIIVRVTFVSLLLAFLIAIAWFIYSPDFEPALTSIALIATIMGLFIDRWLANRERRQELLHALAHELYTNLQVLADPVFHPDIEPRKVPTVYPRLFVATLETVIASGAFIENRDRRLFQLMHSWQERAKDFNRRLDITELRTFTNPSEDEISRVRNTLTSGKVLSETKRVLQELSSHLVDNYAKESGVGRDTILFGENT